MITTTPPSPGHATVCRDCAHFVVEAFDQGHPSPCRLNRWEETKHLSPAIAEDGRSCGGLLQRLEFVADGNLANGAAT